MPYSVADPKTFRGLWRGYSSRDAALHVHNISDLRRVPAVLLLSWICSGDTAIYFHSGTLRDQLAIRRSHVILKWIFRRMDLLWTTNSENASILRELSGREVEVVSPFSINSIDDDVSIKVPGSGLFLNYSGKELYGIDLALQIVDGLRAQGDELRTWTLAMYGTPHVEMDRLERAAKERGVTVLRDLSPSMMKSLLSKTELLLRPTSADGDAMVVREAIAYGCRVIASDVAPRPKGVETVQGEAAAWLQAVQHGGLLSTGVGTGEPIDRVVSRLLRRHQPDSASQQGCLGIDVGR